MFLLICMHVFIHLFIQSGWIVSSVSKQKYFDTKDKRDYKNGKVGRLCKQTGLAQISSFSCLFHWEMMLKQGQEWVRKTHIQPICNENHFHDWKHLLQ